MQSMDVEGILLRGKEALGFEHDSQLAEALQVSRPTIASWRRRGSIPAKYLPKMLDNGRVSFDWLLSGIGQKENYNDYGIVMDAPGVDPHLLWLALTKMSRSFEQSENDTLQEVATFLTTRTLREMHIELDSWLTRLARSKRKWEASNLIRDEDIYHALATEFDLTFLGQETRPWWERDEAEMDEE